MIYFIQIKKKIQLSNRNYYIIFNLVNALKTHELVKKLKIKNYAGTYICEIK